MDSDCSDEGLVAKLERFSVTFCYQRDPISRFIPYLPNVNARVLPGLTDALQFVFFSSLQLSRKSDPCATNTERFKGIKPMTIF